MEENKVSAKHVYDGIEEQDNPMPDWWIWLFILCVIFAFIYWIHYFSGSGVTLKQEYTEALQQYHEKAEKSGGHITETEDVLAAFMKGEIAVQEGAGIFAAKCAICHGANLEGKIGPNLTDRFWTTGNGSRMNVIHTITEGSPAKGMPPWESQLKPNEIKSVAAFVYSKIGSNPPHPKPPEGTEVK